MSNPSEQIWRLSTDRFKTDITQAEKLNDGKIYRTNVEDNFGEIPKFVAAHPELGIKVVQDLEEFAKDTMNAILLYNDDNAYATESALKKIGAEPQQLKAKGRGDQPGVSYLTRFADVNTA